MIATRPTIVQLESRCQKPDHRRIGNWMARRVSRPLALRITWIVLPWGISAHAVTLAAWMTALAAAVALGQGTIGGWIVGAALLQLWYLLDHVDGQLARYHGTASLDGVQLDYLMHHTVNLLVPWGIGFGLFLCGGTSNWLIVGLTWSVGLLLLGLQHDARYKAFTQRLKRVRGELRLLGGGGTRPLPASGPPSRLPALAVWLARKACEMHVIMNLLAVLALAQWLADDQGLVIAQIYTGVMAVLSAVVAAATLARSVRRQNAEAEFARWYRPPDGSDLVFQDGWWIVLADVDVDGSSPAYPSENGPQGCRNGLAKVRR